MSGERTLIRGDLTACFNALRQELGDRASMPALITMRRHAKAGLLNQCEAPAQSGRTQYVLAALRSHYFGDDVGTSQERAPSQGLPVGPVQNGQDLERLLYEQSAAMGVMQKQMHAMAEVLAGLQREVQGLNAVRQSLMMKYDASYQGAREMVTTLRESAARAGGSDVSQTLGLIQNDIKIVKNTMNDLGNLLRRD